MYINNIEVKIINSHPLYAASECGKIFRISSKKEIKQIIKVHKSGYPSFNVRLCINNKALNRKVHRLVCEAWNGEPPTKNHTQVNHKDGNSLNNYASNLEWATPSQNQRHAVDTGLKGKGQELYNSQLTDQQVHEICRNLVDGVRLCDIAKKYNTSKDIIRKIRAGDTYFHVRVLYPIVHTYKNYFSESTIEWVCKMILQGYSDKGIVENSRNPNLTIIEIKRIRYKIRYKEISDKYF